MAAALFLSDRKIPVRIIDKKSGPSSFSKALGVNPRTLELLEPLGLTEKFLRNGRKMESINLWRNHRLIFKNQLSRVHHRYPFMLIQPQQESERLLAEELERRGTKVEWETTLEQLHPEHAPVRTKLQPSDGSSEETAYDFIIGADGANSTVRQQVHLSYEGFRYHEVWELYDIVLDSPLSADEGHIFLFNEGGMLMIRLRENLWRVAGNLPALLDYLPAGTKPGSILWRSSFTISHQLAKQLGRDGVAIIGDAAHLHSPVGARGMNLGIEDAFILSELIADGSATTFTQRRRPYLRTTVQRINAMTQLMTGHNYLSRQIRKNSRWLRVFFPILAPAARRFIMGLNT